MKVKKTVSICILQKKKRKQNKKPNSYNNPEITEVMFLNLCFPRSVSVWYMCERKRQRLGIIINRYTHMNTNTRTKVKSFLILPTIWILKSKLNEIFWGSLFINYTWYLYMRIECKTGTWIWDRYTQTQTRARTHALDSLAKLRHLKINSTE